MLVPSVRFQEVTVIPISEQNILSPKIELVTGPMEEKEVTLSEQN